MRQLSIYNLIKSMSMIFNAITGFCEPETMTVHPVQTHLHTFPVLSDQTVEIPVEGEVTEKEWEQAEAAFLELEVPFTLLSYTEN